MFTSSYGAFGAYACCIQMLYEKDFGGTFNVPQVLDLGSKNDKIGCG